MLIGSTATERSLVALFRPKLFDLTWQTLPAALEGSMEGVDPDRVIKGYRALYPDIDPARLYFDAITDNTAGRRTREMADRKAAQNGAPAYQYYLAWETPVDGGKWGTPRIPRHSAPGRGR